MRNMAFFLLLSFPLLGILTATSIKPWGIDDEPRHWNAAMESSESLEKIFQFFLHHPSRHMLYGTLLTYPGVFLARVLTLYNAEDIGFRFYLARIFQGMFVFLCLLRIYFRPAMERKIQWAIISAFTITLSPLFISQSFAISGDAVCLAFGVCLVNILLFWQCLSLIDFLMFLFFGFAACTTKPNMFLLVPITIVFCHFYYKGSDVSISDFKVDHPSLYVERKIWQSRIIIGSIALGALTVVYSYLSLSTFDRYKMSLGEIQSGASAYNQLKWLLDNPIEGVMIILKGLNETISVHLIAGPIGWFGSASGKIYLSQLTHLHWNTLLFCTLFFSFLEALHKTRIVFLFDFMQLEKTHVAVFNLAVMLISLYLYGFVTALMGYISWNTVGVMTMWGMQTRYLLPAVLLFSVILQFIIWIREEYLFAYVFGSAQSAHEFPRPVNFLAMAILFMFLLSYARSLHADIVLR